MYAKIESERLLFIRLNQTKLRSEQCIHLRNAVVNDGNTTNVGRLMILPSSYAGIPRHMHEYGQDAIAVSPRVVFAVVCSVAALVLKSASALAILTVNEITLDFYIRHYWIDQKLKSKSVRPYRVSTSQKQCLWTPDTYFPESRILTYPENSYLSVRQNGEILGSDMISLTPRYSNDLHLYPFDTLTTKIRIESYTYGNKSINLKWKDAGSYFLPSLSAMDFKVHTSARGIETVDYTPTVFDENDPVYQVLWFELKLRRSPLIALMSIYFPALMIVMVSWLAFLLPEPDIAAKLSISITSILSLVTLASYADSKLPKVSYFKGHDVFIGFCFVIMFSSSVVLIRRKLSVFPENNSKHASKEIGKKVNYWFPFTTKFTEPTVFFLVLLSFNCVYWPAIILMSEYSPF
ncbi:gamma-aminobutyric acid receptor subunit rho-2-like [Artemia franciscana]|uniref:gamma-aminobutyric acid receptor subunit rho-2-like n=1 Tax=Artemia franciscana TaxID=6661 RepID=UPI0032DB3B80